MALTLKRMYQGYFYIMEELADPRAENLFMMRTPFPLFGILIVWLLFVLKWGPEYMKDRKPYNLKHIMIVYNIGQVLVNAYVVYYVWLARGQVNWRCTSIDYSTSYWGVTFLKFAHIYFLLKVADLVDTVFFVLRKKTRHISFLHLYHHFGMTLIGWLATKFVGGGHSYFIGLANCIVHTILYSYYLLTAYDSKYSQLLWLKKFITQAQLIQFLFVVYMFGQIFFVSDCNYPKIVSFFIIPQDFFMLVLFGDFYVRTYHIEPKRKRKELEEKKKVQELEKQKKNENSQEKKDS